MIRYILRFFTILFKILGAILLLVFAFFVFLALPYLITPRYNFPEPKPFAGNYLWNPYERMDSTQWIKANLHMHSYEWWGLTNGTCSPEEILSTYRNLGFESLAISNYEKINKVNQEDSTYIPTYEHGFGLFKNHHLCLDAKKVLWFDYFFRQGIHQKQHVLFKLRPTTELLAINHPSFAGGFEPDEFSRLTNYDFVEAVNGYRISLPHWDSALSAGKPVYLLANDDAHDIKSPKETARCFMWVNAPSNAKKEVLSALKQGKVIGVSMPAITDTTFELRKQRLDSLPKLQSLKMNGDTLVVAFDKAAEKIVFYGQNGTELAVTNNQTVAKYGIRSGDTYVRTEVFFENGLRYFLNPVFKVSTQEFPQMELASVNVLATWIYRAAGLVVLAVFIFLIRFCYLFFRKKR